MRRNKAISTSLRLILRSGCLAMLLLHAVKNDDKTAQSEAHKRPGLPPASPHPLPAAVHKHPPTCCVSLFPFMKESPLSQRDLFFLYTKWQPVMSAACSPVADWLCARRGRRRARCFLPGAHRALFFWFLSRCIQWRSAIKAIKKKKKKNVFP